MLLHAVTALNLARWPSGKAGACKALITGSNPVLASIYADMAQLVEHHLAKVGVAGSNPVVRSRTSSPSTEGLLISHIRKRARTNMPFFAL